MGCVELAADDRAAKTDLPPDHNHHQLQGEVMLRSIKSIHADMYKCATKIWDPGDHQKDWDSLTTEFQQVVDLWQRVNQIVNPGAGLGCFDGDPTRFSPRSIEPEGMAISQAKLKLLLSVNDMTFSDWFDIRQMIAHAANRARDDADMDEVVWVFADFLRLEEGQAPPAIQRIVVDRDESPFGSDSGLSVDTGDYGDERSWYEDFRPGPEGYSMSRGESANYDWWKSWSVTVSDPRSLRSMIGNNDDSLEIYENAVSALKPIFAARDREWRSGLREATVSLLRFVQRRSRRMRKTETQSAAAA
jgi:hypothetical protein